MKRTITRIAFLLTLALALSLLPLAVTAADGVVVDENFESETVGQAYSKTDVINVHTNPAQHTIAEVDGNKVLQLFNGAKNTCRFNTGATVTGDGVWQFDFKFNDALTAAGKLQILAFKLGATDTKGNPDPFEFQFRNEVDTGKRYFRVYGDKAELAASEDGIVEAGKNYTLKVTRTGSTVDVKLWEVGQAEPATSILTFTDDRVAQQSGQLYFVYTCTDLAQKYSANIDNLYIYQGIPAAAPETTAAPVTTAAPETQPVTTPVPTTTPVATPTADVAVVIAAALAVAASGVVIAKKKH